MNAQQRISRYAVGVNDSVRFQTSDAGGNRVQCVGVASSATADTIGIVNASNCPARVFATSEFNKLQVFHGDTAHRGNHAGAGALVGAVVLDIGLRTLAPRRCGNHCENLPGAIEVVAFTSGGFIGMFVGAFVDAKPIG